MQRLCGRSSRAAGVQPAITAPLCARAILQSCSRSRIAFSPQPQWGHRFAVATAVSIEGSTARTVVETRELVLADDISWTVEYGRGTIRPTRSGSPAADNCGTRCNCSPTSSSMPSATEFSAALSAVAQARGYRVTLCDARSLFATPERFAGAEIVVDWPTVCF